MTKPINILFISHYSEMYGANQSMLQLILELRNNYNIQPVILLRGRGTICELLENEKIPYIISHFYWWVNENKGLFKRLLNYRKQIINLWRLNRILKLVEPFSIEIIYSNSVTINMGALLKKNLGIPHIWHFRESLESFKFKLSLGGSFSKIFLKKAADKYILISEYLCKSYSNLLPCDRIQLIYNGIDFSNVKIRENRMHHTLNFCMVGLISEQKNNLDALKAIHILKTKYNVKSVKLHLIGGSKPDYIKMLKLYVTENKLEDNIIFHGHQLNVHELLETMNLGLMCSRDEAFGRVSVEYMMHSMPVLASNSGANQEIVKDGTCGFIYDIYNADDLAKKIYRFIQEPGLLNVIGQSAYEYAKANFSSEQNTKAIYDLICEVLENNIHH